MKLSITTLGIITNIGASNLDKAITLAGENSVLDATGDGVAYIDIVENGFLDILFLDGVLSAEEHDAVMNSEVPVSTLLLTA